MNTNINYVQKINNLGKVCRIILVIIRIIFCIAIIGCLIGGILLMTVTKNDAITANGTASYQVIVDNNKLPNYIDSGLEENKDTENATFKFFDSEITINDNYTENEGVETYDVDLSFDVKNSGQFKTFGIIICFSGAVMLALGLIAVIFGGKLASALEKCSSPFEENVLKAMKRFAFSIIPVSVFTIMATGSVSLITIGIIVLAVIIFSYIFSYGAKLQQESDETL